MWLALSGAFRARWSDQIHHEWKSNLLKNRSNLTSKQLDRTIQMMNDAVQGSIVTDFESLIEGLTLPDPDDRHVLAAAIRCGASVIVAFNQADFPSTALEPYGIEA
jgi:predicted nucleic acid-binding protein